MNSVFKNVSEIMERMGEKVRSDKHMILLYYKFVDKVDVDKESMNTRQFLDEATCPVSIVNAKHLYEIMQHNKS